MREMFATIVSTPFGEVRSSWFRSLKEAIEYAERNPGVIEIEQIGVGTVWTRPAPPDDEKLED